MGRMGELSHRRRATAAATTGSSDGDGVGAWDNDGSDGVTRQSVQCRVGMR